MSNINNAIYKDRREVGYRCNRCGSIEQSMWGTVCNSCRDKDEKHNELLKEIKKLKKQLAKK